MENIFVYVNVKGRVIECIPDRFAEIRSRWGFLDGYSAGFKKQTNAEEKRGDLYYRILSDKPGEIKNHAIWLEERDMEKARQIFLDDVTKRFNKISKQFNNLLEEKERLEQV